MDGTRQTVAESIPLVISGAPRSGTSLLYNLFDGHPEVVWLVDEGFLFEYLYDIGPAHTDLFLDALPEDVDALVAGLRDKQVIPPLDTAYKQSLDRGSVSEVLIDAPWNEAAFRSALTQPREDGLAGLWRWLVAACLAGMGSRPKRYACLKSPDYGKSSAGALDAIAESRAVVIVRDPLYALDSLKRSRELRGEKLLTWPLLAQNIRSFLALGERIRQADPERIRVVRYESLIAGPEQAMRSLAEWLEIAFDPCLLEPTMRGKSWPGISSFKATDGIESAPADRPIQALTDAEQMLVRSHLEDFRARFDYA
jgi:hypothetical protein